MLFGEWRNVFPAQAGGDGEIRAKANFILGEETEIIVEGEALGVADVADGVDVSDIEVGEFVDDGVVRESGASAVVDEEAGVDVEQAAFEVVVETLHVVTMEFAAKFEGVTTVSESEVVDDLEGFAETTSRNAVACGTKIFEVTIEVNFGQADVPGAHIKTKCGRIDEVGIAGSGVSGIETGAETRIAETDFVDLCGREGSEPIHGNDLNAGGRNLFEAGKSRTAAIAAERAERELLVAVAEGIASADGIVLIESVVGFGDEIVAIVFIADRISEGTGIAGGKKVSNLDERGIDRGNRGAGNGGVDGESLCGGELGLGGNG